MVANPRASRTHTKLLQPDIKETFNGDGDTPIVIIYYDTIRNIIDRLFRLSSKLPMVHVERDSVQDELLTEMALAHETSLEGVTEKPGSTPAKDFDWLPSVLHSTRVRNNKTGKLPRRSTSNMPLVEEWNDTAGGQASATLIANSTLQME